MKKQLETIQKDFEKGMSGIKSISELESFEQEYFSRKSGKMSVIMKDMKDLSVEDKKEIGKLSNQIKIQFIADIETKRSELESVKWDSIESEDALDVTTPNLTDKNKGSIHPVTRARWAMEDVARSMGFIIEDGPELESDFYVFEGLNFPPDHPARESMDTFYIKNNKDQCMRAHVSNLQVRMPEKHGVPLRAAYPGRVFRNEATDASHEHTFDQFEAIVIDRDINIGHLIGVIKELLRGLFKKDVKIRLRPGHFPFVEPGFEMDIACMLCSGDGCPVCKHTGWVEMLGCGLTHPEVIRAGGYDPNEWRAFAFGMGLTRLAMMKYGIKDIRLFQSGDLRFLNQF